MKHQWIERGESALIILFLLSFVGLQALGMALKTPLGAPPDERAHLSYINDVMQPGVWVPDYRAGEIYGMNDNLNYLKHPALYYSVLGLVGQTAALDVYQDFRVFRLINIGIVLVGLAFFIGFCRRMDIGWFTTSVLTLSVTVVPMFGYIAGSVNNDNLAYAAVAMFFFGLAKSVSSPLPAFGWMAFGFVVAALTKVTAAAFLSFFLLIYLLREWRRLSVFFSQPRFWVSATSAIGIVAGYYLFVRWQYGSFLPSARYLYTLVSPDHLLSFSEYFEEFMKKMIGRGAEVMGHISFAPLRWPANLFYAGMFLLPLSLWLVLRVVSHWRISDPIRLRLADSLILAFLAVLALHISIGYEAYSNTGALGGMQPRYYLYLIPFILTPAFFLLRRAQFQMLFAVPLAGLVMVSFWGSVPFAHERQYIEIQSRHSPLIFQSELDTVPVRLRLDLLGEPKGNVDEFWIREDTVFARGWAFNYSNGQPVNRVLLVLGDTIIGSKAVNVTRPDVARVMASRAAVQAGFAFFTYGLPSATSLCELSLLIEFNDGSHGVLQAGECSPWRVIQ